MTRKKPARRGDLERAMAVSLDIAEDAGKAARDRNTAVANVAKLLAIQHKISPGETEDFFG